MEGEISKSVAERKAVQKGESLREFIRCYSCGLVYPADNMERVKVNGLVCPKYVCQRCSAGCPPVVVVGKETSNEPSD